MIHVFSHFWHKIVLSKSIIFHNYLITLSKSTLMLTKSYHGFSNPISFLKTWKWRKKFKRNLKVKVANIVGNCDIDWDYCLKLQSRLTLRPRIAIGIFIIVHSFNQHFNYWQKLQSKLRFYSMIGMAISISVTVKNCSKYWIFDLKKCSYLRYIGQSPGKSWFLSYLPLYSTAIHISLI